MAKKHFATTWSLLKFAHQKKPFCYLSSQQDTVIHKYIKSIAFDTSEKLDGKVIFNDTESIQLDEYTWIYEENEYPIVVVEFLCTNVNEKQTFSFDVEFKEKTESFSCCFTPLNDLNLKTPSILFINSFLDLEEKKFKITVLNNGTTNWNGKILYQEVYGKKWIEIGKISNVKLVKLKISI